MSEQIDALAVYEAALDAVGAADFKDIPGCIRELEACNRGLAYLDHLYGRVLDELDEAEATWDSTEAKAARAARDDAPSGATATEIKGRIIEWVEARPSALQAREAVKEQRRRKDKIDRWMRSLEKRGGFSQSAQNGHDKLGKYGGGAS